MAAALRDTRLPVACLLLALFLSSGCDEPHATRAVSRVLRPVAAFDERQGDPLALATTRTVAVLPFANRSGEAALDTGKFAETLANQLASSGLVRVVYPGQVMRLVEQENLAVERHNLDLQRNELLGKQLRDDRQQRLRENRPAPAAENRLQVRLDPVTRLADAIKVGRLVKADVVLMGVITDYDPYYRPRLVVDVQAVATGQGDTAAAALADLTQWGVPRQHMSHRGVVWQRQQVFDTRDGGTARDLYLFARHHHTEDRPYNTEVYLRSMSRFFEFVGGTLAGRLLDAKAAAIDEMAQKAEAEARSRGLDQDAVRRQLQSLVYPNPELPAGRTVVERNLPERRDFTWTREAYSRSHPDEVRATPASVPASVKRW